MSVRANSIATKTEFVGARTAHARGHHSNGQSGTIILLAGLMLLISTTPAYAEEKDANFFQQINLNGSLRTGYFGASRKLDGKEDLGTGSLWLKSSSNLGDNASFMAEGWLRNDETFRGKNQTSLREGYFNITAGEADFRIGKQIIVWGRADGLNPTDNLTPKDYTLLTPESDDQRRGAVAAKMTYHFQDIAVTAILLPEFKPNIIPMPTTTGVYFSEQVQKVNQAAIKLDQSGGTVDSSISYFDGLDLNPDFNIGAIGPAGLNLILQHNRIRVLGMDAATVLGQYGLRAEAAYTWTANVNDDPLVKKPFLYAVMGGDRTFANSLNINIQYFFRQIHNFRDPQNIANPLIRSIAIQAAIFSNQLDPFQHGFSMRLSNKWLNETLEGEIVSVYSLTRNDYALRPKLIYAYNDQMKGTLGMDIYRGSDTSFYGRLRDMSSVYAEIKYSF